MLSKPQLTNAFLLIASIFTLESTAGMGYGLVSWLEKEMNQSEGDRLTLVTRDNGQYIRKNILSPSADTRLDMFLLS